MAADVENSPRVSAIRFVILKWIIAAMVCVWLLLLSFDEHHATRREAVVVSAAHPSWESRVPGDAHTVASRGQLEPANLDVSSMVPGWDPAPLPPHWYGLNCNRLLEWVSEMAYIVARPALTMHVLESSFIGYWADRFDVYAATKGWACVTNSADFTGRFVPLDAQLAFFAQYQPQFGALFRATLLSQLLLRPLDPVRKQVVGFEKQHGLVPGKYVVVHLRWLDGDCPTKSNRTGVLDTIHPPWNTAVHNSMDICTMSDRYLGLVLAAHPGMKVVLAHDRQQKPRAADIASVYKSVTYSGPHDSFVDLLLMIRCGFFVGSPQSSMTRTAVYVRTLHGLPSNIDGEAAHLVTEGRHGHSAPGGELRPSDSELDAGTLPPGTQPTQPLRDHRLSGRWVLEPNTPFVSPVCCGWDSYYDNNSFDGIDDATRRPHMEPHFKKDPQNCGKLPMPIGDGTYTGRQGVLAHVGGRACTCRGAPLHWRDDLLPTWSSRVMCDLIGKRKVMFIGDSTMEQTASTFMNAVFPSGCQEQVVMALADTLVGRPFGHMNRGKAWTSYVEEHNPDIVVLSVGAHVYSYPQVEEGSFDIIVDEVITKILEYRTTRPQLQVIWKTLQPGGCTRNMADPVVFEHNWGTFRGRDERAIRRLSLFNVPILDLRMLHNRSDAHISSHDNPHADKHDCLHFCIPGPLDVVPVLMQELIATMNIGRSPSPPQAIQQPPLPPPPVAAPKITATSHSHDGTLVSAASSVCPYINPATEVDTDSHTCSDGFVWLIPRSCVYNIHSSSCVYSDPINDLARWPELDTRTSRAAPVLVDVANAAANRLQPLVSAIHPCVSQDESFLVVRRKLIAGAMALWSAQHYDNLEYVIVYRSDDVETARVVRGVAEKLSRPGRRITPVTVNGTSMTLGEVRNHAIAAASGDYVTTWDDDDLHHPLRIAASVLALQCSGKNAVLMDTFMGHWATGAKEDGTFLFARRSNKMCTLLAARSVMTNCYSKVATGEDWYCGMQVLAKASPSIIVTLHAPWLYYYVRHGDNVTPKKAFDNYRANSLQGINADTAIVEKHVHNRVAEIRAQLASNPLDGALNLSLLSVWPSARDCERTRCGPKNDKTGSPDDLAYFAP